MVAIKASPSLEVSDNEKVNSARYIITALKDHLEDRMGDNAPGYQPPPPKPDERDNTYIQLGVVPELEALKGLGMNKLSIPTDSPSALSVLENIQISLGPSDGEHTAYLNIDNQGEVTTEGLTQGEIYEIAQLALESLNGQPGYSIAQTGRREKIYSGGNVSVRIEGTDQNVINVRNDGELNDNSRH